MHTKLADLTFPSSPTLASWIHLIDSVADMDNCLLREVEKKTAFDTIKIIFERENITSSRFKVRGF